MTAQTSFVSLRQASIWSIVWGILLVIFGALVIASPYVAAVTLSLFIAWLIVFGGVVHLVLAFHAHRAGSLLGKLLVGLAYVVIGGYLLMHPLLGVATLTLLLAALFLIEGALNVGMFFQLRPARGSGWMLLDGLITLVLAAMIAAHWPSSALWAIGTLVGVSLIFSGASRVMMSLAARRGMSYMPDRPMSKAA
ncbi:MAG TPA: DUF308 domain-containing protein [Terriglobales bacterium]|nr:DUF308 domain-containing protein [Terriglobales bacterium]